MTSTNATATGAILTALADGAHHRTQLLNSYVEGAILRQTSALVVDAALAALVEAGVVFEDGVPSDRRYRLVGR
jgi:hypothetical protein